MKTLASGRSVSRARVTKDQDTEDETCCNHSLGSLKTFPLCLASRARVRLFAALSKPWILRLDELEPVYVISGKSDKRIKFTYGFRVLSGKPSLCFPFHDSSVGLRAADSRHRHP